jgi:hypothetical protein
MTSAMLLEYEDNNVGEDESANDQRSKWRVKNEEMPKKLTVLGPLAWPFHVSRTRDWSPFNPIYAGTMRLCKWIKAYGHCRASTTKRYQWSLVKRCQR